MFIGTQRFAAVPSQHGVLFIEEILYVYASRAISQNRCGALVTTALVQYSGEDERNKVRPASKTL